MDVIGKRGAASAPVMTCAVDVLDKVERKQTVATELEINIRFVFCLLIFLLL